MSQYYVYALLDPRKPTGGSFSHVPKYIGKGRGSRAKCSAFQEANYTNTPKAQWVRRLRQEGLEPLLRFVKKGLVEREAFDLEKKLIAQFGLKQSGNGPLLNRSGGGEGGRHFDLDRQEKYRRILKKHGKGFKLVPNEPLYGLQAYAKHECPEHGVVRTSPLHVVSRLKKGSPPCPRCGTEQRGPAMREHRLATGWASYQELFQGLDQNKYKVVGRYLGAGKATKHWCSTHGYFLITPANVRSKVVQLKLSPCPDCNKASKVNDVYRESRSDLLVALAKELSARFPKYSLLSKEFVSRAVPLEFKCPTHGKFSRKYGYLVKSLREGRSPCPECNLVTRNLNNGR